MTGRKFLYYTPWCLTDSAMIASGISYNGVDPKTKSPLFDKVISVFVIGIETGTSTTQMIPVKYIYLIRRDGTI